MEVVALLSQGRTAAAQCGFFTQNQSRSYLNHLYLKRCSLDVCLFYVYFKGKRHCAMCDEEMRVESGKHRTRFWLKSLLKKEH